jgi:hypothetical protein
MIHGSELDAGLAEAEWVERRLEIPPAARERGLDGVWVYGYPTEQEGLAVGGVLF